MSGANQRFNDAAPASPVGMFAMSQDDADFTLARVSARNAPEWHIAETFWKRLDLPAN
jgi:hypothetical protein